MREQPLKYSPKYYPQNKITLNDMSRFPALRSVSDVMPKT